MCENFRGNHAHRNIICNVSPGPAVWRCTAAAGCRRILLTECMCWSDVNGQMQEQKNGPKQNQNRTRFEKKTQRNNVSRTLQESRAYDHQCSAWRSDAWCVLNPFAPFSANFPPKQTEVQSESLQLFQSVGFFCERLQSDFIVAGRATPLRETRLAVTCVVSLMKLPEVRALSRSIEPSFFVPQERVAFGRRGQRQVSREL